MSTPIVSGTAALVASLLGAAAPATLVGPARYRQAIEVSILVGWEEVKVEGLGGVAGEQALISLQFISSLMPLPLSHADQEHSHADGRPAQHSTPLAVPGAGQRRGRCGSSHGQNQQR
jgi:hypothetical protein